ncbi:MAG: hypothetical protein FVQ79_09605 [Planctomycetes bacterium]|nr:hypothetical protein [Planctomycetota bacterium]
MKTFIVKTGFGYYEDAAGRIFSKAELPAGDHNLRDGLEYIEVADKAALDALDVYVDPADIEKRDNENKIQKRMREIAIDQLKAEGGLPADYVE